MNTFQQTQIASKQQKFQKDKNLRIPIYEVKEDTISLRPSCDENKIINQEEEFFTPNDCDLKFFADIKGNRSCQLQKNQIKNTLCPLSPTTKLFEGNQELAHRQSSSDKDFVQPNFDEPSLYPEAKK